MSGRFRASKLAAWAPALVAAVAAVALLALAGLAEARPGGGSSYSGGGSGGSGGGGGGDDALGVIFELLIWLCIEYPAVGFPLLIVFVGVVVVNKRRERSQKDWSAGAPSPARPPPRPPSGAPPLEAIARVDPGFSRVIFEDFLYSLYAEVHRARGLGALHGLSAYLSPAAAQALQGATRGPVEGVIVGAMRVMTASASPQQGARVTVELESNYTEAGRGCYVVEQWTLVRGPSARSRTPDRVRVLGCPSCGAPQAALFSGTCRHCGRVVNDGSFDWLLAEVRVLRREERPPMLTADVAEEGTDLPTVYDPALSRTLGALRAKDPTFDAEQLKGRIGLVFQQFQIAWSSRNLAQMRPFLSDALFTTQQYWISAYLAQKLRNVTEGARITSLEVVKVASDPYFDAITVRLFATGLDYTVTDEGRVVSGSRRKPRPYSEYWTFIRGTNRKGPARAELACANCGGPLAVNMAGTCNYCNVKVTTGDFDWVLSRIEQDESYTG